MSWSPDHTRHLAPAGPALDPAPFPHCSNPSQPGPPATHECPPPTGSAAHACSPVQAAPLEQMHPASQRTHGQVGPQMCSRLATAVAAAPTSPLTALLPEAPTHSMPEGSEQQHEQLLQCVASPLAAAQPHASPNLQKQALQAQAWDHVVPTQSPCASAVPQTAATDANAEPAVVLQGMADAVLPAPLGATPQIRSLEQPASRTPPRGQAVAQLGSQTTSGRPPQRGQAVEAATHQGSHSTSSRAPPRGQAAETAAHQGAQSTFSRAPPRGQTAETAPQQGAQARHAQAAASRSSRNISCDRNAAGTRMSLRSRNPAPDKAIRKASSSSRSGGVRSASVVGAPAYATRYESCCAWPSCLHTPPMKPLIYG